ncbi:type II toxin-antitoxin system HicB family antitoxin [Moorellaceae bacterium AZ2]
MKFIFTIEEMDNGRYLATCDELNAVADGETEEEAITNLKEAVKELLKSYPLQHERTGKRLVVEVSA